MKRFRRRFRPRPLTPRRKATLALVAAIPVLAVIIFGNRGILTRVDLELEESKLHEQLYRDRAAGDSMRAEIARHRNDMAVIERLARERFGMARPGETIYRVVDR